MNRRQLPIGIQDFRTIRENPYYYVDKTPLIRQLVEGGRHYFLSRPRRFGKSLLLDTLRELFAGNEPLFRGLHIHGRWDWSTVHPVVRLSFGAGYLEPGSLSGHILEQLARTAEDAGIDPTPSAGTGPQRLEDLLYRLHRTTGKRVVVLVDEYDKPILDALDDPALARANRDYLRGFYGVVKDSAEHVRFVFVTGVTMFSKVSLFSGLNNLMDISLDPRYATLCGYTDGDLDAVFAAELPGLDREAVREWYNGYHWRGGERVYNPFDVLLLFARREFRPWWFETGSPTFLYRTMMENGVSPLDLENRVSDMDLLSTFDVGDIGVDALLFQAGYLTITGEERAGPETRRHGAAPRRAGVRDGVQDGPGGRGRGGGHGPRHGADLRTRLRRQAPRPRRPGAPARRRVRPARAQPAGRARRTALTGRPHSRSEPTRKSQCAFPRRTDLSGLRRRRLEGGDFAGRFAELDADQMEA